ncbi:hypothetical protein NUW54_g6486 [Trametes sanguinea]|uniref:Uncharacterized protein n=1 Tax=Trametes sanguinea TaxID=158606 RepID=A0ACC1PS35_9APHY|nr:hypothetical protein NUW54_g6486 [Trametes sanguinea]
MLLQKLFRLMAYLDLQLDKRPPFDVKQALCDDEAEELTDGVKLKQQLGRSILPDDLHRLAVLLEGPIADVYARPSLPQRIIKARPGVVPTEVDSESMSQSYCQVSITKRTNDDIPSSYSISDAGSPGGWHPKKTPRVPVYWVTKRDSRNSTKQAYMCWGNEASIDHFYVKVALVANAKPARERFAEWGIKLSKDGEEEGSARMERTLRRPSKYVAV